MLGGGAGDDYLNGDDNYLATTFNWEWSVLPSLATALPGGATFVYGTVQDNANLLGDAELC